MLVKFSTQVFLLFLLFKLFGLLLNLNLGQPFIPNKDGISLFATYLTVTGGCFNPSVGFKHF